MAQPRRRRTRDKLSDRVADQRAAGLDTAPIQRCQHGQELAPAPMTRAPHQVANGVKALYDAQSIGDAALSAVARFHDDYVLGVLGVRDTERMRGSTGAADPHVVQLARCKAVGAHRAIAEVIGPDLTIFLVAFVVEDLSFSAMDRRFARGAASSSGRQDMATTIRVLLAVMPGIYVAIDRKPVAPRARPITTSGDVAQLAMGRSPRVQESARAF
jgi:hypothetical protein